MGTLFNQPERRYLHVDDSTLKWTVKHYAEIAKENKCSVADVVAIKAALEQERANSLRVEDGDIKDEQLAGFGELLRSFWGLLEEAKREQSESALMVKEAIDGLADAVSDSVEGRND